MIRVDGVHAFVYPISSTLPVCSSAMCTATSFSESDASSFGRAPKITHRKPMKLAPMFSKIPIPSRPSPATALTTPSASAPITHAAAFTRGRKPPAERVTPDSLPGNSCAYPILLIGFGPGGAALLVNRRRR